MKIKTIILLTLSLVFSSLVAQAQNNIFDKLEKAKDVQSAHFSESLISMLPEMKAGNADLSVLADKLKQIDIYSSKTADAAKTMRAEADNFAKDKTYETFMTVKDKSQNATFYGKKDGEKFKELVMVSNETQSEKCVIIRLIGDFTAKDIQDVVKK